MARVRRVGLIVGAAVLGIGVLPSSAAPQVKVQASDFQFCAPNAAACAPTDSSTTTVKRGTRVTWVYTDHACDAVVPCPGHNVIFANGSGEKKLYKSQGVTMFSMVFRKAGTYSYWCGAHKSFGMVGTVVVTKH
jgi:plastocyanin